MTSFWKNKRISVTGGEGFLGGHLVNNLKQKNPKEIMVVSHSEYDLVNGSDVKKMYKDQNPDIVFHLAATVGGIGVNQRNPGKFFYENAVMNLQVIHNAYLSNVENSFYWNSFIYLKILQSLSMKKYLEWVSTR